VVPYAARQGYQRVEEYTDEAIAGDELEKRKQFQRMLRDAQAGKFSVILCDDKDRFGRFDFIDYGEVVGPLRRAGVRLETVAQGRVDWESFAGRITDAIFQEAKAMEIEALSRRVLTGALKDARVGKHLGGSAPYGYRLVPDDKLR
jgi:site-specific DNA recombinase